MKKFLLSALATLFVATQQGSAIPANPEPIQRMQSDGTVVTVRLKGDEKVHWMETLDGYTLMNDHKLDVVFAIKDAGGDLKPSNILYKGQDLEIYSATDKAVITSLPKKLRYSERQIRLQKQIWEMTDGQQPANQVSGQKAPAPVITPVLGEKKVFCILAGFANQSFTYSQSDFDQLMNQVGYSVRGNAGSVKDFYHANSYGKMDMTVTVVGPVTSTMTTAQAAIDSNHVPWVKEVVTLADPYIDYSQFAVNGRVPSFHIVFAGWGDEVLGNGQQIWSHAGYFYQDGVTLDGVRIDDRYSCSPELCDHPGATTGQDMANIGCICHEICHTYGAPDYYDTDYGTGGRYDGTGEWDLMADGAWNNRQKCPAQINMFQKILYGWVNPVELPDVRTTITDMPNSVDSAMAYTLKVNDNGEMYVLENRWEKGFDYWVPNSGLLIYHVHPNALAGNAMNTTHPQQMYVVAANAQAPIPTSDPSTYGSVNASTAVFGVTNTAFDGTSTPQMFSWNGSSGVPYTAKSITEISRNQEKESVSFKYKGGYPAFVDVALQLLVPPVSGLGMQEVKVNLDNLGQMVHALSIAWTVDGAPQPSFSWSGDLEFNNSMVLTIGAVNLTMGQHTISVTLTVDDDTDLTNNLDSKTTKAVNAFVLENWEGSVADWTFANGTNATNKWVVGTAAANGGSKSAYISDDGTANHYNISSATWAHLYRDITFPASTDSFDLYFDVRVMGETDFDFLNVRIAETGDTPRGGNAFNAGDLMGTYTGLSAWQTISKALPPSYSGTTKRLVFSWRNNNSDGAQPPAAIDNIVVARRQVQAYDIVLSETELYEFPAAMPGYNATPLMVIITNIGSQPTGSLNVVLSGRNASSFTLSKYTVSSVAVGDTGSFTVVPKTNLSSGTYTATLTVSGTNSISKSFDLSFTVNKIPGSAVDAPTMAYRTHNSIIVNAVARPSGQFVEYAIHTTNDATELTWQSDTVFENLMPQTIYYVYARSAGNSNFNAGPSAVSEAISTLPVPAHSIALSVTGTFCFDTATYGYVAQTPLSVTITNDGNQTTGALTIALSGKNTSNFTLSKTSVSDIAVGGTDNFTVVPQTGLDTGVYTATVTVSGENVTGKGFDVSFTVKDTIPSIDTTTAVFDFAKDVALNVYPNPVSDKLFIQSTETVKHAEVYDIRGKLVKRVHLDANELSVSDLKAGVYMLKITTNSGTATQRFVKN